MSSQIDMIPLNKLVFSPKNVRTVSTTKEKDKELIAMIDALGVVQNLSVIPRNKKYEVAAGGRRLAALNHLKDTGKITGTYEVPCRIIDDAQATAISYAENQRADMHPADEFMAYQKLADEGKTAKEIAGMFGVSLAKVKQRLKLAGVAPQLVDHYREGKLTLEAVMAFTVSDDHEKQVACYKELPSFQMSPHRIRSILLDQALQTDDTLVKFVTLAAYKKASGTVTSDLFESVSYINDRELLEQLATEKLEAERDRLLAMGWKWGEIGFDYRCTHEYNRKLEAEFANIPEELSTTLKEKNAELDKLNAKDYDEWTDEDQALEDSLSEEINQLEDDQEQYRNFTDEQKAVAGVVVYVAHGGTIAVEFGCVKKEDMKAAFPPSKGGASGSGVGSGLVDDDFAMESQSLMHDLRNFKLQAVQSELLKDEELAYDLMVFSIARQVLGERGWYDRVLSVSTETYNMESTAGIDDTDPAKAIEAFKKSLDVSWMGFEDEDDKFKAFREISRAQKKKILSYCTALTFTSHGENPLATVVLEMMQFDMAQHWQPTKDNYFSRVKKDDLLEIGKSQLGDQWFDDNAKKQKGLLVDILDAADGMKGWMPACLSN